MYERSVKLSTPSIQTLFIMSSRAPAGFRHLFYVIIRVHDSALSLSLKPSKTNNAQGETPYFT